MRTPQVDLSFPNIAPDEKPSARIRTFTHRQGNAKPIFVVQSMDDRFNDLMGMTQEDRFEIVKGVGDALRESYARPRDLPADVVEKYAVNFALSGLVWMIKEGKFKWGDGELRDEVPAMKQLVATVAVGFQGLSDNPPGILERDVPRYLREIRWRLHRELYATALWVDSRSLNIACLGRLHDVSRPVVSAPDCVKNVNAVLAGGSAKLPNGAVYSSERLSAVMAYYGLGKPKVRANQRGYDIYYCTEERLRNRIRLCEDPEERIFALGVDTEWMAGRHVEYRSWLANQAKSNRRIK